MQNLIILPFIAISGIAGWTIVFLETYRHFPKMDKQKRIEMGITNATVLALILMLIVYLFMSIILNKLI